METPALRDACAADHAAIDALYASAFPEEDLAPLVRALRAEASGVLSLVAHWGDDLVGHIAFTACRIDGAPATAALLGPLAVAPGAQRKGVGSALVTAGLSRMAVGGVARVFVLGDPAYYGRFGFETETQTAPPYRLPDDWAGAWRSIGVDGAGPVRGVLQPPPPWRRRALWTP